MATSSAHAQYVGVQAGFGAPPPVVQQQPTYVVQQQQPQYVVQQQQPQYMAQPANYDGPGYGRFRAGFDAGIGWLFAGGVSGPSIVISGRFGWQINDLIGVYYQPTLPIGFASGTINGIDYGGAAIAFGNGLMGEVTFGHVLSLALGPSLDFVLGSVCASGTSGSTLCVGDAGTRFGIQARVSVNLGTRTPYRRRGFRLGVSSHTIFAGDAFEFVDIHAGWEAF